MKKKCCSHSTSKHYTWICKAINVIIKVVYCLFGVVADNGGWHWSRLHLGNWIWTDLVCSLVAFCYHIVL